MGTRSAGLEMEPRRRGDRILKTCAHVRVFEIPSIIVFLGGPITRVALAPRINGPLIVDDWVVICKRGAYCCGTLVHHEKEKPISRRIPRLRSSRGLRASRIAGGPAGGSLRPACCVPEPCARASRAWRRLADPCGLAATQGRGGRRFGRSRRSRCGQQSTPQNAASYAVLAPRAERWSNETPRKSMWRVSGF